MAETGQYKLRSCGWPWAATWTGKHRNQLQGGKKANRVLYTEKERGEPGFS